MGLGEEGGREPYHTTTSIADPDPGSGCLFDSWIRDGKKSDPG
jgi:hypothetical protein